MTDAKRAFVRFVRTRSPRFGMPDGAFDQALEYATFTRPISEESAAEVLKNLRATAMLMHFVNLAEFATVHEHKDTHGPALTQKECEKHRAAFTEMRGQYLEDLRTRGIRVDLEAYSKFKVQDFLQSGAPDPCRMLERVLQGVYRGLGYKV